MLRIALDSGAPLLDQELRTAHAATGADMDMIKNLDKHKLLESLANMVCEGDQDAIAAIIELYKEPAEFERRLHPQTRMSPTSSRNFAPAIS